MHEHAIALAESSRSGPERRYRAGGLVPKRERERERDRPRRPLHDVQVAVAEAGGPDLHQHLSRTGDGRLDLDELRLALPFT
jgi:hypothetical protein